MTGKEFVRKIFSPVVWINLLGMVLLVVSICLVSVKWMEYYTRHGEGIDVPDVKGKLVSDAEFELGELELQAIIVDSVYNKKLAPGIVLDQTPGPGSRVKAGREIYLTVNAKNVPTLPLPNIINNCSAREAEAQLVALGFKIGPYEYAEGDKDWVLGVKYHGRNVYNGERVPTDTPLTLVIGNNEIERNEDEVVYDDDWSNDQGEDNSGDDKEEEVF